MASKAIRLASIPLLICVSSAAWGQGSYATIDAPIGQPVPLVSDYSLPEYLPNVSSTGTDAPVMYAVPQYSDPQQPTLTVPAYTPPNISAPSATDGVRFLEESETSRILIRMETAHRALLAKLEASRQARRASVLSRFEKEAEDPQKVIGLADRLRAAMAQIDALHEVALEEERRRFNKARLDVLSADPVGH